MAYFRFMWLPIDVFASWGSARRVFGLCRMRIGQAANRRRVFSATGWFYRSPAGARDSLNTYGVSEKNPCDTMIFLFCSSAAHEANKCHQMHGSMLYLDQFQALVQRCDHLVPP
jgi:hypothetical protein